MSDETIDLVRWTFSVEPEHAPAIEAHLVDLGPDVHVHDGGTFVVSWDEPDADLDLDALLEALWALHGAPFEVVQEDFQRQAIHHLHHEDDASSESAAA